MYSEMHDGWSWFWMVPMMFLWLIVVAAVVYAAVRVALQHSERPSKHS